MQAFKMRFSRKSEGVEMFNKNRNNAIVEFLLSVDTTLTQIGTQCKADFLGELLSDGRLTSSQEC